MDRHHDLVARYVAAVRPLLPRKQQDDICAELTDALRSRIEDREEALGRPLSDAEVEQVLKERSEEHTSELQSH